MPMRNSVELMVNERCVEGASASANFNPGLESGNGPASWRDVERRDIDTAPIDPDRPEWKRELNSSENIV